MNKIMLINHLSNFSKDDLLSLIETSLETMNVVQRDHIFYQVYKGATYGEINSDDLNKRVDRFIKDSHEGIYCVHFDINSKNYMDIPEETEEWFELIGDLLLETAELSHQRKYQKAIEIFSKLFELVEAMETFEDDIVFAKRYGSWMISIEMEGVYKQYIKSVSKSCKQKAFLEHIIYLHGRSENDSLSKEFKKLVEENSTKNQYQQFLNA